MYIVYILENETRSKWYYGFTENMERRLEEHNTKRGGNFTRQNPGRWILIFQRKFENKSDALKFEIQLKKFKNKTYIRQRFSEYFSVG